jgi:hypothetical protein
MPTRIDTDFAVLLGPRFRLEELDRHPASVFGLWQDLRIAYINPAWTAFAEANNGKSCIERNWGLGARYLDAIPGPLRPFYEDLLAQAPDPRASLHPVSHQYECSSAVVFRKFSMQIYSLEERAGFVVINSLLIEEPQDPNKRPPQAPDSERYLDSCGNMVQCSHCRRVQSVANPIRWDWVPAWVEHSPAETSHGICSICLDYYYPNDEV